MRFMVMFPSAGGLSLGWGYRLFLVAQCTRGACRAQTFLDWHRQCRVQEYLHSALREHHPGSIPATFSGRTFYAETSKECRNCPGKSRASTNHDGDQQTQAAGVRLVWREVLSPGLAPPA